MVVQNGNCFSMFSNSEGQEIRESTVGMVLLFSMMSRVSAGVTQTARGWNSWGCRIHFQDDVVAQVCCLDRDGYELAALTCSLFGVAVAAQ